MGIIDQKLYVQAYSGFDGASVVMATDAFRPEPAMKHRQDPAHPDAYEDYSFQDFGSLLWDGEPKPDDASQGMMGDCYLISSMIALAASDPAAVKRLFSPQASGAAEYAVTLYQPDGKGKFTPQVFRIDTRLAATKVDGMATPAFAEAGKVVAGKPRPIWPALLEKAYAELMGGSYDLVGAGGTGAEATQFLTGRDATFGAMPATDAEVLAKLRALQASHTPALGLAGGAPQRTEAGDFCAPREGLLQRGKDWLHHAKEGPYQADLRDAGGEAAQLVPGSIAVSDRRRGAGAKDDARGGLAGAHAAGSVDYGLGKVSLSFERGSGPAAAGDLTVQYDWQGMVDRELCVYSGHAYAFESVTPDGLVVFKNPWGVNHPKPMKPADVRRLFQMLTEGSPPATAHRPKSGET